MSYTLEKSTKNVSDVVAKINPLYHKIFQSLPEHFLKEKLRYGIYERLTLSEDGSLLTFPEELEAAYANGVKELETVTLHGLAKDEEPRYILMHLQFRELEQTDREQLIDYYTDYLKNNPKGKEWAKELAADGYTEMNDKLAVIFNVSKDLLKHVKKQQVVKQKQVSARLLNQQLMAQRANNQNILNQDTGTVKEIANEPRYRHINLDNIKVNFKEGKILYKGKEINIDESQIFLKTEDYKVIIEIDLSNEAEHFG